MASLLAAGWRIDAEEPHVIEASDGERYGACVFFEGGLPVEVCYGDGEEDLQHQESWHEVPGILSPTEVGRLSLKPRRRRRAMTPEEKNPKADGRTVRAARNALAKKQINRESYNSVLSGELTIQEARNLGREGAPKPPGRKSSCPSSI